MTTVFISGSRDIPYLPEESKVRIDRIVQRGLGVVVGDSERGVDARVLEYLFACRYPTVTVYTVHDNPRVAGIYHSWKVHKVDPPIQKKVGSDGRTRNARELETAKDEAMGEVSDYGLVIWKCSYINRFGRESVSRGSLRNMHQLLATSKPVVLYRLVDDRDASTAFSCYELRRLSDLQDVIDGCPDIVRIAYEDIVKRYDKQFHAQGAGMQLKIEE